MALCLLWGGNWVAIKVGVEAIPVLAFTALRSILAGIVLLALANRRGVGWWLRRYWPTLLALSLLTNSLAYAGLFWGTAQVPSGLAALVNLSLMPIALFVFGLLLGQQRFFWVAAVGLSLGVLGLALLFGQRLEGPVLSLWGLLAIVGGTLCYSLGSVLSRRHLARLSPLLISGLVMVVGGFLLVPLALLAEPLDQTHLQALLLPAVAGSLAYLVLASGVVGFTLYLFLLRDWGPLPAGLYAFVSPLVAIALGYVLLDETLDATELLGGALMLSAAALILRTVSPSPPAPPPAARSDPA